MIVSDLEIGLGLATRPRYKRFLLKNSRRGIPSPEAWKSK